MEGNSVKHSWFCSDFIGTPHCFTQILRSFLEACLESQIFQISFLPHRHLGQKIISPSQDLKDLGLTSTLPGWYSFSRF